MEDVVLSNMCPLNKVPNNPGIIRYLVGNAKSTIQTQSSGNTVRLGANTTNPLSYHLGITRVSVLQDKFNASEEIARAPGILNYSLFNYGFDFEMTFNSG
ncbi:hypothetical protein ES703_117642 [subsurface metagenome]